MAGDRVVLVDGTALIYRAFYALPSSFSTSQGLPTNATYGFALMFRKLLQGRTPRYGAVIFDPPGDTFRDRLFPAYKAQRPSMPGDMRVQLAWIEQVVRVHGFPVFRVEGYEADDVIGTLTRQAVQAGHEVRIVSGDKDFAQLIRPEVRMLDTMRDITYDEEVVRKKWGVRPELFVDYLALVGDKVDNIPGVAGVGQKTAAELLEAHGGLDGVYAALDSLTGRARKALEEGREDAYLSRRLATIQTDVPLPLALDDLVLPSVDLDAVNALYRELEFFSLLSGDAAEETGAEAGDWTVCDSATTLQRWLDAASGPVALWPVFELPSFVTGDWVGVALCREAGRALYVPLGPSLGALGEDGFLALRAWLEDPAAKKLLHDARDTWTLLARHGVRLRGVHADTQLASFLIDPTGLIPHPIEQVVRQYLHRTLTPLKSVVGAGQKQVTFQDAPVEDVAAWAGHLASAVWELWPLLEDGLEREEQRGTHDGVDLPLAELLGRMQATGIRVDADDLAHMQVEFAARRDEVEAAIHQAVGHRFNIGSTKQLGEVLFDELKLPVIKRTKTGYSTDAEVLERLAVDHPVAAQVVRWRTLAKLINTYTQVLRDAVNPHTGRIHCTFMQTTGASGRLITTDPDLQRTPIRTEDGKRIRQAFLADAGQVMISADWSQIELRILAHVSEDPLLCEAFRRNADVHRQTAAELFEVSPEQVTPSQRNVGKTVNFATIYGQGATALGQQLGIGRNEAKRYIDRYFERYHGVRDWLDRTIAEARGRNYVTTLLGRRRYIPELTSNNFSDRAYGDRIAANTPIQGSAADICKLAMLGIDRRLREARLPTRMLLQIHDELLFECPPEHLEATVAIVRECMERVVPLKVPLVVDVGWGSSWAEAH